MHKDAMPAQVGSNDGLSQLPETDVLAIGSLDMREDVKAYSAETMETERRRCYALGAAAERERWQSTVEHAVLELDEVDDATAQAQARDLRELLNS